MKSFHLTRFIRDYKQYIDQKAAARPKHTYGLKGYVLTQPFTQADLEKIEHLVNVAIRDGLELSCREVDGRTSILTYRPVRAGARRLDS